MLMSHRHSYNTTNKAKYTHFPMSFYMFGHEYPETFLRALSQLKYLVVVTSYFTKYIKVESLGNLTKNSMLYFFKRHVPSNFDIPITVVTNNKNQFTGIKFE